MADGQVMKCFSGERTSELRPECQAEASMMKVWDTI